MISREICAALILRHDFSFEFVEFLELRTWIKYLNPDVIPISRNTAKVGVMKMHEREGTTQRRIDYHS